MRTSGVQANNELTAALFRRDGYVVLRKFADSEVVAGLRSLASEHLEYSLAPLEYESDVGYPGSPSSRSDVGGATVRRLLGAAGRNPRLRAWATSAEAARALRGLIGAADVMMSQSHHNCIMTKHPGFSSATLWHQDNRYWSFDEEALVTMWLALGAETRANGCLRVIPGSHKLELDRGRLDAQLFLRPDLEPNKELITSAVPVELKAGDVLFFHSRLFHAAGRNRTRETKFSVVFTYHSADNCPIAGTRSAQFASLPLD